jgi:hypothetical protein
VQIIVEVNIACVLIRLEHRVHELASLAAILALLVRVPFAVVLRDLDRHLVIGLMCVGYVRSIELVDAHLAVALIILLYVFKRNWNAHLF